MSGSKRKPVMIGAHVPNRVPWGRARRDSLAVSAEMINRNFEEVFLRKRQRSHLAYRPMLQTPRS